MGSVVQSWSIVEYRVNTGAATGVHCPVSLSMSATGCLHTDREATHVRLSPHLQSSHSQHPPPVSQFSRCDVIAGPRLQLCQYFRILLAGKEH